MPRDKRKGKKPQPDNQAALRHLYDQLHAAEARRDKAISALRQLKSIKAMQEQQKRCTTLVDGRIEQFHEIAKKTIETLGALQHKIKQAHNKAATTPATVTREPEAVAAAAEYKDTTPAPTLDASTRDMVASDYVRVDGLAFKITPIIAKLRAYTQASFGSLFNLRRNHVPAVTALLEKFDSDMARSTPQEQINFLVTKLSAMDLKSGGTIAAILTECKACTTAAASDQPSSPVVAAR